MRNLLGTLLKFLGGFPGGPYPCREERGEQPGGGDHPVVGDAVEEIQPVAAVGAIAEGLAECGVDPLQTAPVPYGYAGKDSTRANDHVGQQDGGLALEFGVVQQESDAAFDQRGGASHRGDGEHDEEKSRPQPSQGDLVEGGGKNLEDETCALIGLHAHCEDGGEDGQARQ